jgi:hypothetical protein
MTNTPRYAGRADPSAVSREDVFEALDFLVEIEPDPEDDTIDEYEDYLAHLAPWQADIDRAMTTLRRYAAQQQPRSLPEMQEEYYDIIHDDRLTEDDKALPVAQSALTEAWDGIGPWRK